MIFITQHYSYLQSMLYFRKVKEESENAISAAASVLPRDEVQQSDDGALVEVLGKYFPFKSFGIKRPERIFFHNNLFELEPISVDCKLDRKSEEEPDPTLGSERYVTSLVRVISQI